jgi:hypothetical protein
LTTVSFEVILSTRTTSKFKKIKTKILKTSPVVVRSIRMVLTKYLKKQKYSNEITSD